MDGHRFDAITRVMAASTSRRTAIRALIGALTGSAAITEVEARTLTTRRPITTSPAPTCPVGQQCGQACCEAGQSCCNGTCCTGTCAGGLCCPPQTSPCGSSCCPAGLECCGNQCCSPELCSSSGYHCCPANTTVCGEECCVVGDQCCDGECCPGVCYGEELCCLRPREYCLSVCCELGEQCCLVDGCCDGTCTQGGLCCPERTSVCGEECCDSGSERCCGSTCIPRGDCCEDSDCTPPQTCGGGGVTGQCGCTPERTCSTEGFDCGLFTDDCNVTHPCGTCTNLDVCIGSPAGVCQCVTDETCDQRCGPFTDICGITHNCDPCPTSTTPATPPATTTTPTPPATTTTPEPVCVPIRTCATEEITCGSFVDDCGVTQTCAECGTCRQCNASNQCVTSPQFTDCGVCRVCDGQGACVQAPFPGFPCQPDACTILATCTADGACGGGQPLPCEDPPDDRCGTTFCDPVRGCVRETTQFDGSTGCNSDPCDPGICMNGSCLSSPIICPRCKVCDSVEGNCVDDTELNGASCGEGDMVCVQGECCSMLGGPGPLDTEFFKECLSDGVCCAENEGPCCPGTLGTCCESCFQIEDPGGEFVSGLCCPVEQLCNEECCWPHEACIDGHCVREEQVCADNTVCLDRCCGGTGTAGSGTCCGSGAYCVDESCVPVQSCTTDGQCAAFGSSAKCVNGSCCPDPRQTDVDEFDCCLPQQGRSSSGECCGYPNYTGACIDCFCSFSRIRRLTR